MPRREDSAIYLVHRVCTDEDDVRPASLTPAQVYTRSTRIRDSQRQSSQRCEAVAGYGCVDLDIPVGWQAVDPRTPGWYRHAPPEAKTQTRLWHFLPS